jgi:hypothetical protein
MCITRHGPRTEGFSGRWFRLDMQISKEGISIVKVLASFEDGDRTQVIYSETALASPKGGRQLLNKNMICDRKLNEFCSCFDPEILHHAIFVKGYGPRGHLENIRRLLHRSPLC